MVGEQGSTMSVRRFSSVALLLALGVLGGCAVPQPYRVPTPTTPPSSPSGSGPATTTPAPTPESVPEAPTPPPPVIKEPVLSSASRALVAQAQSQTASKNFPLAAA